MLRYGLLIACLYAIGGFAFAGITADVHAGRPWAVVAIGVGLAWVVFGLLRFFVECKRNEFRWDVLRQTYSPRYQSWAYLLTPFTIVLALGLSAAWFDEVQNEFFRGRLWYAFIAPITGIVVSVIYHFSLNRTPYTIRRRRSPTYVLNNWVIYPVLAGTVVGCAVPFISVNGWQFWTSTHFWIILGCILVWVVASIADGKRRKTKLDPERLHRSYSYTENRPVGSMFGL